MAYFDFLWTETTIAHLAEHGISPEDFENAFLHCEYQGFSRSSGRPVVWGETIDGRYIIAAYDMADPVTVIPVTAYEVARKGES